MFIITSGLTVENSQGDPRNLPEGAAVRLQSRHGPHSLYRMRMGVLEHLGIARRQLGSSQQQSEKVMSSIF